MLRKILFLVLMLGAGQVFADVTVVDVPGEASTTFTHSEDKGYVFTDTWSLNITDEATASSGAVSLSLGKTFGITDFVLAIYDYATSSYLPVVQTVSSAAGTYWSFIIPSAGLYDLLIKGTISGSDGGSYVAGIVTTAVPEPGVYLLILVGLVGLVISKRQRSTRIPTMMQAA